MNKTQVLKLLMATLISCTAYSATIYKDDGKQESVSLYGKFETGGFFGRKYNDVGAEWTYSDGYIDDSFMSFGIIGRTGQIYTALEFDVERTTWTEDNQFQHVIDKAYVGWDFGSGHRVEAGRTDTAYDRYDGLGDFSVYGGEGSAEIDEAGDQDSTIKYEGSWSSLRFGISHSQEGWDEYETDSREGRVTNGYLGYFSKRIYILAGLEEVDDRGTIYSVHGTAHIQQWSVGAIYSVSDREEREAYNTLDSTTQVYSLRYQVSPLLDLAATYSSVDVENETIEVTPDGFRLWRDDEWHSVSAEFAYRPNVKLKAQYTSGGEMGSFSYAKLAYFF